MPASAHTSPGQQTSPGQSVDCAGAEHRVLPSRTNPGLHELSRWIGGPFGRHGVVGRQPFLTPTRVLTALALLGLLLGLGSKAPCLEQHRDAAGQLSLDWNDHRQYSLACYSDIVPLYFSEGLDQGKVPYRDPRPDGGWMEYPTLLGFFQYGAALAARGVFPTITPALAFFICCALVIALAWLVVVWAVGQLAGRRIWDGWLVALSPVVFVQVFTNFDALGIALLMGALLAWRKEHPRLAGVLLGLGAAVKLFPALLFFPLLLTSLRGRRLRPWLQSLAYAAAVFAAVNLPVALLWHRGWSEFFRYNAGRDAQEGSLYALVDYFRDGQLSPAAANTASLLLVAAACALIAALERTAPRLTLEQLAFLTMAAFLLTSKVWSPQYSLWLVPLAALALPRARLLLTWMSLEVLSWAFLQWWLYASEAHSADLTAMKVYFVAVALRDLTLVATCAAVIWQIRQPSTGRLHWPTEHMKFS